MEYFFTHNCREELHAFQQEGAGLMEWGNPHVRTSGGVAKKLTINLNLFGWNIINWKNTERAKFWYQNLGFDHGITEIGSLGI
jgi:hypothetical protein